MSGQPSRTQADINKFRNEYMETLDLQDENNDMNLQANKTYLLTGQLPPQSQMQDTRTNAEKLADIEKLKQDVVRALSPIYEPHFAYQIVNEIINSPLNLDNSLFRYFAQRISSFVEQLKKVLPYGVAGDENDLTRIVEYIKNMYSETQGKFQSTKSYMNSLSSSSSSSSRLVSANDLDSIITQLQDIIKNIDILIQKGVNLGGIPGAGGIAHRIKNDIILLKRVLPTTNQIKLLLEDVENPRYNNPYSIPGLPQHLQPEPNLPPITQYSRSDMEAFFKLMEKLPKYTEVMALIGKIKQHIESENFDIVVTGLNKLEQMFNLVNTVNPALLQQFRFIKDRQSYKEEQTRKIDSEQTRDFIRGQNENARDISKANKVYVINPQADPVWTRVDGVVQVQQQGQAQQQAPAQQQGQVQQQAPAQQQGQVQQQAANNPLAAGAQFAAMMRPRAIQRAIRGLTPAELQQAIAIRAAIDPTVVDAITLGNNLIADPNYNIPDLQIGGLGLKKKRRGRPLGSGLVKSKPVRIPTFVGFGINEINNKQLSNGILKIRRSTGTNYMDMPSRRISKNLQGIIKTILGGGVPQYNELGNLDEDEKNYLHKIISRSNLEDRLSVPAPSKDQQEKDIHNFEVMKGQLLSGNDSKEMVKKFKLLSRKLSRQGLLPKSEVDDLIDTLTDLGY